MEPNDEQKLIAETNELMKELVSLIRSHKERREAASLRMQERIAELREMRDAQEQRREEAKEKIGENTRLTEDWFQKVVEARKQQSESADNWSVARRRVQELQEALLAETEKQNALLQRIEELLKS
jgi:hypothetical protein